MATNKGKISGVSLGPGEPELITLKALNVLNTADVIYCPATHISEVQVKSRSLDILRQLPVNATKIHTFCVPMSRNRDEAITAYDQVCTEITELADAGKSIAITAEGDACFYSSANYLYEKLQQSGYPVNMVAGVPAFIAAGASIGLHLVKQQERLLVIPGDVRMEELVDAMMAKHTVVIMKVPLGENVLRSFISRHPGLQYHYFEQIGTPKELFLSDPAEILSRTFTYFSILVIRA